MRTMNLDQGWTFDYGLADGVRVRPSETRKTVDLPHDYMIESDSFAEATPGPASGYFTAGVAHYEKKLFVPAEWEGQILTLVFDGAMMNATVDVNGAKAALQHYGYAPFAVDITPYVYFGEDNRIVVTVNPSMQPNCRWYSGAGLFRSVKLVHTPVLHIATDGIFAYTQAVEDGKATVKVQVDVANQTLTNRIAEVQAALTTEEGEVVVCRKARVQINPNTTDTAYLTLTVQDPQLWSAEEPNLYKLKACVKDVGEYRTHLKEIENGTVDEAEILFGIRTVTADVNHGLRVNGKEVKLKGGCLHHDNGLLGAVSLYDAEYRKLSILKSIGFNAVRTTHNPPSAAFMEACDRLGVYVFDEAFDAWGIAKQPGDYNQFFETDWQKDLTAFVRRDRSHPSVVIWSTGNEIPERGGLNNGYTLATRLAETVRALDPSRPVSNAICSFWSGLDDKLQEEMARKMQGNMQNADVKGEDLSWEEYSEAFTNGLDIVGYNYLWPRYEIDAKKHPKRVIHATETQSWHMYDYWNAVIRNDNCIGDFTWTATDNLGEAGAGRVVWEIGEGFAGLVGGWPWLSCYQGDLDLDLKRRPQSYYRGIVWGLDQGIYLFTTHPEKTGKPFYGMGWHWADVRANWTFDEKYIDRPVQLEAYCDCDEVEFLCNGASLGRVKPEKYKAFLTVPYTPGKVEAIAYRDGMEAARTALLTAGDPAEIALTADRPVIHADGMDLAYVTVRVVDQEGRTVVTDDMELTSEVEGGELLGFGSANPCTEENYTNKRYVFGGYALACVRAGRTPGEIRITVRGEGVASGTAIVKCVAPE